MKTLHLQFILMLPILSQYCVCSYAQVSQKFFRSDYNYFESTESFYKIHTIAKPWQEARKVCASEGALFFYPQDGNEADVVSEFLRQTQPTFGWISVGAAAILAKGVYETVEGVPVQNLYHNWEAGEPNSGFPEDCMYMTKDGKMGDWNCSTKYPFVCKKSLSTLQWNEECSMPNTDYVFNEALGGCYKFHLNPLNWMDAYATCSAEQSHLAVITTQAEADYLVNITANAPKESVEGDYLRGAVHLGFHNRMGDGWTTITGVPLANSGYSKWAYGEPNSAGGPELCGSMYYVGSLNDIGCYQRMFFICEHEVQREITTQREDDSVNMLDEYYQV